MLHWSLRVLLLLGFMGIWSPPLSAQLDCGIVDSISFPVDPAQFRIAQEYAVASSRHQGRFHSGEDWYGGNGTSYGQPVQAAARGRVTYSYHLGWGRDGGVVILEHTLPDGTIFYTQYGHMMPTDAYPFPTRLSCVERGTIIGTVGDARPAPHLHFEVRSSNGSDPGAGYTRSAPYTEGYRDPGKFIVNLQAWLSLWHEWHLLVGDESPADERGPLSDPVVLNDNSLLYLDGSGSTLRRATPDGRVLWRIRLEIPAVSVLAVRGSSLLVLRDGTFSLIDVERGTLGDSWQINASLTGAPLLIGDTLAFPAAGNELLLIDPVRREISARYSDIPDFIRAVVLADRSLALLTARHELLLLNPAGEAVSRTRLREPASFAELDGNLLAYTRGGLWRIDRSGTWSLWQEDAPPGGTSSALLVDDTRVYAFSGSQLLAYDRTGQPLWEAPTPAVNGLVELSQADGLLLITSTHGDLLLITADGRFCNQAQVSGGQYARQWHTLGNDGLLRVAVSDQIFAFDWDLFSRPCRV